MTPLGVWFEQSMRGCSAAGIERAGRRRLDAMMVDWGRERCGHV